LALHPGEQQPDDPARFDVQVALVAFVQLDGKCAGRAAIAGGEVALADPGLDQALEALAGVGELVQAAGEQF
jgi:hypothetical protein